MGLLACTLLACSTCRFEVEAHKDVEIGGLKRATELDSSVICAENQYCSSIAVDRLPWKLIMELYKGMSLQTLW